MVTISQLVRIDYVLLHTDSCSLFGLTQLDIRILNHNCKEDIEHILSTYDAILIWNSFATLGPYPDEANVKTSNFKINHLKWEEANFQIYWEILIKCCCKTLKHGTAQKILIPPLCSSLSASHLHSKEETHLKWNSLLTEQTIRELMVTRQWGKLQQFDGSGPRAGGHRHRHGGRSQHFSFGAGRWLYHQQWRILTLGMCCSCIKCG